MAAVVAAAAAPAMASAAASMATQAACCVCGSCASKLCCGDRCCGINSSNVLYFLMWLASALASFLLYVMKHSLLGSDGPQFEYPPTVDSAFGQKVLKFSCPDGDPGCQKTPYVLRMTFACSLFFLLMFVFTIGSNITSSFGHKLHDGFWILKWILFILLHFASIFIPYQSLINYSYLQSVGAACFLLVQIILLIDFCYDAADWFKENGFKKPNAFGDVEMKPCWGILMILVVVGSLSAIITMIALGFRWFTTPVANSFSTMDGSCSFNSFVLAFACILIAVSTVLQIVVLARTRNGSIVTALFIGAYVMWNIFSGLLASKVCQSQIQSNKYAQPVSVLLTIFSTAYAAIQFPQITSDNQSKTVLMKEENKATQAAYHRDVAPAEQLVESEAKDEATPYSYPKFHVAFCFASCFLSMQLSSWLESQRQPTPMNGTTPQAWVKIVAAWVCSLLYIWTLVAPLLFPHRFKSAHVPYMSTA